MPTTETIALDPIEFIPSRKELGLDELGLRVVDADWGDSEHELFLVRQKLGEIPADRHPPNRTVTIKLQAKKEGAVSLAKAAQQLQQKVGRLQDEGGWVRRDFDTAGGFKTSVGFIVHTAVLGGIHGWLMAHRGVANEVTLILTTGPYCYGTEEIESGEFKGSEVRQLEWELEDIQGSAPGIYRMLVKNEGTRNWMGLIAAMESRDHSGAATAALSLEAENLTLLGAAAKATRTGASGGAENNVVKSGSLSSTWKAILNSKIVASGEHLTHVGTRRILCRVWDPTGATELIKLKLEWRPLGSLRWISNPEQVTYLVGNFSFIDFGEVRLDTAVIGNQRWEFRILAKTEGTIGDEVQLDQFHIVPTEQYLKVQEELEAVSGGTIIWEDHFEEAEGALTGKVAPIGGTYEGAGDAVDFTVVPASFYVKRSENKDADVNTGRYVVAGSSKKAYTAASLVVSLPTNLATGGRHGLLLRYTDVNNWLRVSIVRVVWKIGGGSSVTGGYLIIEKRVAGVVTILKQSSNQQWLRHGGTIEVTVDKGGNVTATVFETSKPANRLSITATDEVLSTGKTLAEGKVGVYDAMPGEAASSTETRTYSEALASTEVSEGGTEQETVCFAGRSMEVRSDGVFRQHPTDNVWARSVPDGFLPFAPPSGLENRPLKGLILPSLGNFEVLPDETPVKVSAKVFYFPGYHFASEAA